MYPPQYPTPPPGYVPFDYMRTPPVSPTPQAHAYYSPRYSSNTATPSPRTSPKTYGHSRRASHADPPPFPFTSSRMPNLYSGFATPRFYPTAPQREPDYVSDYARYETKPGHYPSRGASESKRRYYSDSKHRPSYSRYVHVVVDDDYVCDYGYRRDEDYDRDEAPPPYEPCPNFGGADYDYFGQVPIYDGEPIPRARPRRASTSVHNHHAKSSTRARPSTAKSSSKATEEDARRAGIPAGYSYKNWDPKEEPILLLGSVFDANSLGKWIYDWTVFYYGPGSPMSEQAGDLWLLLIQLAGKVKRAEEAMPKIRKQENREMVEEFLESGERLWGRFAKLLKVCESYMMDAAKRENGGKKPTSMGKNSGCEFVDSMFGRDRELERTEKLMTGMRLWSMRFDANCQDIIRHPSA